MRVFYAQAVYGQEEINAVVDVLANRPLSLMAGSSVSEFERRIAARFGKAHGLMVNSGSSANMLAVGSMKLAPGAEVITPALTFSTTVAPIVQRGLLPVFVDVEPGTYNVDASKVEELISNRTKAMIVPNLIGNLPDWSSLARITTQNNLALIEDSADTLGAVFRGQPTGKLSDISTTSFYASHVITCAGFGGMVCTDDQDTLRTAKLLRGWGRSSSITQESEKVDDRFGATVDGISYDSKFIFEEIGYNFLPSELAAAFGLVQLDKLDEYLEQRIKNFSSLIDFFSSYEDWFILPRQQPETRTGWLAFPLTVRDGAPFDRRDLQLYLESKEIQTRSVFTGNILRQPGFAHIQRRESPNGYPNADHVMRGGILLGCHHGMGEDELQYVSDSFKQFAGRF